MWIVHRQQQHPGELARNANIMDPVPDLLSQNLWGWGPDSCVLTSPSGVSEASPRLGSHCSPWQQPCLSFPLWPAALSPPTRLAAPVAGSSYLCGTGLGNITTRPASTSTTPAFLMTFLLRGNEEKYSLPGAEELCQVPGRAGPSGPVG